MRERLYEMECPYCGHSFFIKRSTWEMADKELNDKISSGLYFTHKCQKCHKAFQMVYPFVYRNRKKGYILVLSQMEEVPQFTEEKKVVVCRNPEDFAEAARILNCDENLKEMINLRNQLRKQTDRKNLRFELSDESVYWFHDGEGRLAVRRRNGEDH